MKMTHKDILTFKRLTKSRMATGYTKDVDFTSNFIFETWLLEAIHTYKRYAVNELMRSCRERNAILYKSIWF